MDQYVTWYGGRPPPRRLCVRLGPGSPPQKGAEQPPIFRPTSAVDQRLDRPRWHLAWRWGSVKPHCTTRGPSSPSHNTGQRPQFSAHFYCGQTAGWIKMRLGMEVGLGPADFVLDGDPAPPSQKGAKPRPSIFAYIYRVQMAEWIKMTLGRKPRSRPHCARQGPMSKKGT